MYIDVNGKRGYRQLMGTSGKTYGNVKLFSQAEKDAMLADGITVYTPPPPQPESPEAIERKRKRAIRGYAYSAIDGDLLGEPEEGDNPLLLIIMKLLVANRAMAISLINKGLMVPTDFQPGVKDLSDQTQIYLDVRQAAIDAIANSDSVETAVAAIDLLIPPQVGL